MNKDIKNLWITALRSEEYPQHSKPQMKSDKGFDALGVLCELHRKRMKKESWKPVKQAPGLFSYLGSTNCLPVNVVKWAGLRNEDAWDDNVLVNIKFRKEDTTIAFLCDEGLSFDELANIIAKKL